MQIPYHKKWVILEKEDYANYLYVVGTWEGFTIKNPEFGFVNCSWLSAEYINKACNLFLPQDVYQHISKTFLESIFTTPDVWDKLHQENIYYAKATISLANKIKKLNVRQLTNHQVVKWLTKFAAIQMENHDRRGPMFLVEVKDNLFSNYLYEYLRERCQDLRLKISSQEAFQILTTSSKKSFLQKEREDLVKVAMIKEREQQKKAFARHFKKYEWLEYGLQGKILKKDYFQERLKAIKKGVAKKLLIQMQKEKIKLLKKQQKFLKELKIHQTHRHLFKIARDSIYGKNFSKDAQFYSYYAAEKLFKEVGRRSNLTLEQLKFLTFPEYKEILLKGKDYAIRANERMKYSIHFANKGKTIFFHGKDAKKIRKKLHFIKEGGRITKQNELKGNPAYPGKVIGKVKIINTVQEMMKMHRSDVLVSHMTNPDIVPVMKQASAIITDLGGITCHAAIISRELKIPCIIGTKIATQMLKDGDKVEVDANKGIVKKL